MKELSYQVHMNPDYIKSPDDVGNHITKAGNDISEVLQELGCVLSPFVRLNMGDSYSHFCNYKKNGVNIGGLTLEFGDGSSELKSFSIHLKYQEDNIGYERLNAGILGLKGDCYSQIKQKDS